MVRQFLSELFLHNWHNWACVAVLVIVIAIANAAHSKRIAHDCMADVKSQQTEK